MRPALYVIALTADALAVALLLVTLAVGHMATPGVVAVWAFMAILVLNAAAIVVAWRFSAPKADANIVASTFT